MGAIGFELRKHLRQESFGGLLRGYGYAGLISAGPWVVSILGVLLTGRLCLSAGVPGLYVQQFAVTVTYLMAGSLILTGLLQLLFTRFVADRLFEKRPEAVVQNLLGALTLTTLLSGTVGTAGAIVLFQGEAPLFRLLLAVCFVSLCDLWIVVVLLSGLKAYRTVLLVLLLGYALATWASTALSSYGLVGLLAGFTLAQGLIFIVLLGLIMQAYPTPNLVAYAFLKRDQVFYSLAATGLLNNIAIWADKFIFWMTPETSDPIIGPLRASLIYDLPIFMAYLSIIPGMGVFLMRMEVDFAERYKQFYDAVRGGESLPRIQHFKERMVLSLRQGLYEIFKVQGMTVLALILIGPRLLPAVGISRLCLPLFNVDLVAVGMQMVLLGVLNAIFYFDYRRVALWLNLVFALLNILFTRATLELGYPFYGYGYALATTLTTLLGLLTLMRRLDQLEYETFMLQK